MPTCYRITVGGRIGEDMAPLFDGMLIEWHGETTDLVGEVRDQAGLVGIIDAVSSFGLDLIRVEPVAGDR